MPTFEEWWAEQFQVEAGWDHEVVAKMAWKAALAFVGTVLHRQADSGVYPIPFRPGLMPDIFHPLADEIAAGTLTVK